jgi:ADP-ribosylglycohydrolase
MTSTEWHNDPASLRREYSIFVAYNKDSSSNPPRPTGSGNKIKPNALRCGQRSKRSTTETNMRSNALHDRAAGAILGAFIGEALGVGPHWYYNLAELRRDYGDWITGYTDPQPDRYHAGLKAGQLSQAGLILRMLLESLVERGTYDEADFCRRLDEELFPQLDGTPMNGPGGYTSQSIRAAWRQRVQQGLPWSQTGGHADTT